MSNILSSLWKLIKKIFKVIIDFISNILGDWWLLILVIAVIWFAPAIAVWLAGMGAPSWCVAAFEAISVLTPTITSWGTAIWNGVSGAAGSAWTTFGQLTAGQQAAVALGASAALAPDETAEVLADVGNIAGEVIGSVVGGLSSTPLGSMILVGLGVWAVFYLFGGGKDKKGPEGGLSPAGSDLQLLGGAQ